MATTEIREKIFEQSDLSASNRCERSREFRGVHLGSPKKNYIVRSGIQRKVIRLVMMARKLDNVYGDIETAVKVLRILAQDENVQGEEHDNAVGYLRNLLYTVPREAEQTIEDLSDDDIVTSLQGMLDDNGKAFFEAEMGKLDYPTEATRKAQTRYYWALTNRYLESERDIPIEIPLEYKISNCFDVLRVETRPDLIFDRQEEHRPANHTFEFIRIKPSKPNISVSGRKIDNRANSNLQLGAQLSYGAQYFRNHGYSKNFDYNGGSTYLRSSFYFLGRKDDKSSVASIEATEFFESQSHGKNIVSATDYPALRSWFEKDGLAYAQWHPLFEKYADGIETDKCTPEMCDRCRFKNACEFNAAPVMSDEEKPRLKADEIELSKEQEEAVYFRNGIVRINAGAGAGKTMIVALRTAFMLSEGIKPEEILLITFTNTGAREMKERIVAYTDDLGIEVDPEDLQIMTFNAFGQMLIEKEHDRFSFKEAPKLIDGIQRKAIIEGLLQDNEIPFLDYKNFEMDIYAAKGALPLTDAVFNIMSTYGLSSLDISELTEKMDEANLLSSIKTDDEDELAATITSLAELYDQFVEIKTQRCVVEFSDQESLVFALLQLDRYYFDSLGIKHIIVDEYQDTSPNQNKILKALQEADPFESLMVVGDDSQAIFSFRGADSRSIVDFPKMFPGSKDIFLVQNYRSTPEIIDFANKTNRRNKIRVDKDLISMRESGEPVTVKGFLTVPNMYKAIGKEIKRLIGTGIHPSDIVVQAATRKELIRFAGVLGDMNIETAISCPQAMAENSRVIGIIGLAKAFESLKDTQATFDYYVAKNNGVFDKSTTESDIEEGLAEIEKDISEAKALSPIDCGIRFDEMVEAIVGDDEVARDFATRLARFPMVTQKQDYVSRFMRYGGEDMKSTSQTDGVFLTTVHSGKGLEWPYAFVILNKLDTTSKSVIPLADWEERRRLLFVAATRAKDKLYITGTFELGRGDMKREAVFLKNAYEDAGHLEGFAEDYDKLKGVKRSYIKL